MRSTCHTVDVPKLWSETIEAHRATVRDATLDAAAALVAEHGLTAVTMSQIAKETGIGRATLYKYFPDVAAVMTAWHERQVATHLEQLTQVRDAASTPANQLAAVLHAYAHLSSGQEHDKLAGPHHGELVALLHRGDHLGKAEQQLRGLVTEIIRAAAASGEARDDIAPDELANYCLHALTAATSAKSNAAVTRLVELTILAIRR